MKLELALNEDSIFYKLGSSGLITFSDYIFLLTVLSSMYHHYIILMAFILSIYYCLFIFISIKKTF